MRHCNFCGEPMEENTDCYFDEPNGQYYHNDMCLELAGLESDGEEIFYTTVPEDDDEEEIL